MKNLYASLTVPVGLYLARGAVAPIVNQYVDELGVDLVIMGTNGLSGPKEFFIGSNTEKVVRFSRVPVLTVRKYTDLYTIKTIVFPMMFELDHPDLIENVKKLQNFFQSELHLLFINTPTGFRTDAEIINAREEYVLKHKLANYTFAFRNDKYVEDGIINYAQEVGADMIAMATHGRRGLAHLFAGSLTEDIINHADYPIWTYPIENIKPSVKLNVERIRGLASVHD